MATKNLEYFILGARDEKTLIQTCLGPAPNVTQADEKKTVLLKIEKMKHATNEHHSFSVGHNYMQHVYAPWKKGMPSSTTRGL